jgi:hypothetical protein
MPKLMEKGRKFRPFCIFIIPACSTAQLDGRQACDDSPEHSGSSDDYFSDLSFGETKND